MHKWIVGMPAFVFGEQGLRRSGRREVYVTEVYGDGITTSDGYRWTATGVGGERDGFWEELMPVTKENREVFSRTRLADLSIELEDKRRRESSFIAAREMLTPKRPHKPKGLAPMPADLAHGTPEEKIAAHRRYSQQAREKEKSAVR